MVQVRHGRRTKAFVTSIDERNVSINSSSIQDIKRVIVTGAAGFSGAVLVNAMRKMDITVYAIVRPNSIHNERLAKNDGVIIIPTDLSQLSSIREHITDECDCFIHLAWTGDKNVEGQKKNIGYTLDAIYIAKKLGCKRFICTGSQAEYGIVSPNELILENRTPKPFTAYGATKVAACYLSKQYADELGIEWLWGRIFSVIGKYEPRGRMLPDLYHALKNHTRYSLSSCSQNWDYLDVHDEADALLALMRYGKSGEIYNIANGNYKPLKVFTEELYSIVNYSGSITYGEDPIPYVSLQPSVEKICKDTGWYARRTFRNSILDYDKR